MEERYLGIDDFFQLLCNEKKVKKADEYMDFLDILNADYFDYSKEASNLSCGPSVRKKFFNKMSDLSQNCEEAKECFELFTEYNSEGRMWKPIKKVLELCSEETINVLINETDIIKYANSPDKKRLNTIKEIYEKQSQE